MGHKPHLNQEWPSIFFKQTHQEGHLPPKQPHMAPPLGAPRMQFRPSPQFVRSAAGRGPRVVGVDHNLGSCQGQRKVGESVGQLSLRRAVLKSYPTPSTPLEAQSKSLLKQQHAISLSLSATAPSSCRKCCFLRVPPSPAVLKGNQNEHHHFGGSHFFQQNDAPQHPTQLHFPAPSTKASSQHPTAIDIHVWILAKNWEAPTPEFQQGTLSTEKTSSEGKKTRPGRP